MLRLAGVGVAAIVLASPVLAAGIAVLIKAEPSLTQTGRRIWRCTYVVENREMEVVRETSCPPSIEIR